MQKFSESVEALFGVTPRMRRVSWNNSQEFGYFIFNVTPRMRRVSWNHFKGYCPNLWWCHASHEACELKYWSCSRWSQVTKSRLAWGVWVEMKMRILTLMWLLSRLAWGVWVEILPTTNSDSHRSSHASHEACELKLTDNVKILDLNGHASHEACELKLFNKVTEWHYLNSSRLAWGVWVEIQMLKKPVKASLVTPRMRRVSWNFSFPDSNIQDICHASHEACELK